MWEGEAASVSIIARNDRDRKTHVIPTDGSADPRMRDVGFESIYFDFDSLNAPGFLSRSEMNLAGAVLVT